LGIAHETGAGFDSSARFDARAARFSVIAFLKAFKPEPLAPSRRDYWATTALHDAKKLTLLPKLT
jgi:hypothetical protein